MIGRKRNAHHVFASGQSPSDQAIYRIARFSSNLIEAGASIPLRIWHYSLPPG